MFTPYEFDDDSITLRSWDAADIGRLLRDIGIQERMSGRRICTVYVTFHTVPLTDRESEHIMTASEEGHPDDEDRFELPF